MRKCFYLVVLLLVIFDASLRALEKEMPELRIVCDKIEKEEIISAYESYTFEINNYSQYSIAQPQWSYSLFLKEGGENVIATSSGATFTIPIVEDRNRYNISANNTIEGMITFKCIVDGVEQTVSYNMVLDLKPKIISYSEIVKTLNATETAYSIDFTVRYTGKDYLRVGVREEYSSNLKFETIEEPYIAHVHRSGINSTDYAWVYLRVENEYGKDEVIITLERWEDGTGIISHPVDKFTFDLNNASSIMVYSKTGKYLMRTRDTNDLKKLSQDIYILRLCDEKGICYKTIKYVSRT